jgi:methylthioribose-1-phosphate isomerase
MATNQEASAMLVDGVPFRTIWRAEDGDGVRIIDQRWLPHEFRIAELRTMAEAATAIRDMWVRGAPLIGATAAYGVALAMEADPSDAGLAAAYDGLRRTRPTAINLLWALDRLQAALAPLPPARRAAAAFAKAAAICDEDVAINQAIGDAGLEIIGAIGARKNGAPVNMLTHCNAGWLATVDWGTAHGAHLPRPRRGPAAPRLGGRDRARATRAPSSPPGSSRPRRPAHADRGQRRRPPDAARRGGHGHRRAPTAPPPRRRCNKIGTYLKALARRTTACLSTSRSPPPPWTGRPGRARRDPDRGARRGGGHAGLGPPGDGALGAVRICPQATGAANPPST